MTFSIGSEFSRPFRFILLCMDFFLAYGEAFRVMYTIYRAYVRVFHLDLQIDGSKDSEGF